MSIVIKFNVGTATVTIASPAVFSKTAHGFEIGDVIYLTTTGALPTGLAINTPYYIISAGFTADAFQVSATKGGSAINTSGSQSGVHTVWHDKSRHVLKESFSLNRALTSQVDTCEFQMIRVNGTGFKPSVLDVVNVVEDGSTIFGGQIITVAEEIENNNLEVFTVQSKDYSFDMDRFLVTKTYENETVTDIVTDIATTVLPAGYTVTNVNVPTNIAYISFNYEYPTKCFQQLAELTTSEWYVDGAKNIYFKPKTATNAPFGLTDTGSKYYFNSLKIYTDIKNLRNTIYVRGGTYKGATLTELQVADGDARVYTQGFRYSDYTIKVDGVTQTVGLDNLDNPASFDCLYNFQEKAVKWREDNKPALNDVVEVTGLPHIPVLIKKSDTASQNTNGIFEFKIIDKTINSRQGARERANAELQSWAESIKEGEFATKEVGLDVGQIINVQSTIRSINTDFVITRISSTFEDDPTYLVHKVTLATTKTYGMIEFLQGLLIQRDKEIVIDENETIEIIIGLSDSMTFSDSLATPTTSSPPYTWGGFPWGFGTWS